MQCRKDTVLAKTIRYRVLRLRITHGLTQARLCELAGVSSDAVARIESGSRLPSLRTVEKIASVFDLTASQLISTEEISPKTYPPSLMRIIYLLSRYSPNVHEACEKVLRAALHSFLRRELSENILDESGGH